MKKVFGREKCFASKLAAGALCAVMLTGLSGASVFALEAEDAAVTDDPYRLVDIYCSQSAKDALGDDQLQTLVDLIVTSIEPQAVNLLVESFPCFADAAANDELGREIGLYIYYETGDQDGIEEHEDVAPGAYAYVLGSDDLEKGESVFKYLICIDAETLSTVDDMNNVLLDMDGHVNGSTYVSGYIACLYLADLAYQETEGSGAVTFDQNGDIESVSSEKLREGLSEILFRLHQGDTLDEVISEISGGAYENTEDFTKRFIKGTYNEETQDYDGDPDSLSFCVGYLNYMNRLDAMDPETHPVGSVLMDDFGSTQPTPLEKDTPAVSDFYRIVEDNTMTTSTVSSEDTKDGGTSYSGRDSFETVVEMFKAEDENSPVDADSQDYRSEMLQNYLQDALVNQVMLVRCTEGSNAIVQFYQKQEEQEDAWTQVFETDAYIGKNGPGKTKEGDARTPLGDFGIRCAFGIRDNPGTDLDYVNVIETTYACDEEGEYYNQIIDTKETGHDCHGEEMYLCVPEYNYGIALDYNPDNTWPDGSAIFLHCKGAKAFTGGCIAIGEEYMKTVLQYAQPGMRIIIHEE